MKKTFFITILAIAGLTGCVHESKVQLLALDAKTWLAVRVDGAPTYAVGSASHAPGEPFHRVLEDGERKVLFAYDLEVGKNSADGLYHFLLKPAKQKPTFDRAREVTVKSQQESVRVELMERPGTGEKIVDVFSLTPRNASEEQRMGPMAHLLKMHNMLYHWVHGQ